MGGSSVTLIDTGEYDILSFNSSDGEYHVRLWPHRDWDLLRRTIPRVGNDCGAEG